MQDRTVVKVRVFSALLLLLFVVKNEAQMTSTLEGFFCSDTFLWCPMQKSQCGEVETLDTVCMRTCNTCPDEREVCRRAQCSQTCEVSDGRITAMCGCRSGYELEENQRDCRDIDECQRNSTLCSGETPVCRNTPGGYACTSCRALQDLDSYYKSNICCKKNANNSKTELTVILGAYNTSGQAEGLHEQKFSVRGIVVHPDFDFPNNDIALLRLRGSASLGNSVGTICLPNGHQPRVGDTCYATNYEPNDKTSRFSAQLQEVDLPIIDTTVCLSTSDATSVTVNPDQHMCAGHVPGGRRACLKNSGGSLMCQRCNNCDWYIAGVTSFRRRCRLSARFQSYTRVSHVETWIAEAIRTSVEQNTCVRPEWHAWGGWTDCTVSCGGGKRSRIRYCINGNPGEPECIGDETQSESCNAQNCQDTMPLFVAQEAVAIDEVIASWSPWTESDCSATCGEGRIRKVRTCLDGNIGDFGCEIARDVSHEPCNIVCDPTWGPYRRWSECSTSCGGGTRRATRSCNTYGVPGARCIGNNFRTEDCQTQECPRWGDYSDWDTCSATCGSGTQKRTRVCLNGDIGDIGCHVGSAQEMRPCNIVCDPTWGPYGRWSECSTSCGGGTRRATRSCNTYGVPGARCIGNNFRTEDCQTQECPRWGDYSDWDTCSATCGSGTQKRTRVCLNGDIGDIGCHVGSAQQTRPCDIVCDPTWGPYGRWSECSTSCGGGTRRATRSCNTYGVPGARCIGNNFRTEDCQTQECPRWGDYSDWNTCSATCGSGTQKRTRVCLNGDIGDIGCHVGSAQEMRVCNDVTCAPLWSAYGEWSACTVTCGGGMRTQTRTCNTHGVEGVSCKGSATRSRICQRQKCPSWTSYTRWSKCTKRCRGGTQTSRRRCRNGKIGDVGCQGPSMRTRKCNTGACRQWTRFQRFRPCSVTCGGGTQVSERRCLNGRVGDPGCRGPSTRTKKCNTRICETWSGFGPYSSCNASCGLSSRVATRRCLHGRVGQNGCKGSENRIAPCEGPPCDYWEEFGNFSECDASCGGGVKVRSRICRGGIAGTGNCIGNSTEKEPCNTQTCIVPLCCDRKNIIKDATCWDFVRQDYCSLFLEYMEQNCARSCCQFFHRIHCVDKFNTCSRFRGACGDSSVLESCPLTCSACPEDTQCD